MVLEGVDGGPANFPALHEQPAVIAFEADAVLAGIAGLNLDTAGVSQPSEEPLGHLIAARNVRKNAGALHQDGTGMLLPKRPLNDVQMMCAPVGQFAACVVPPPTEGVMTTLRHVIHLRRLPEP